MGADVEPGRGFPGETDGSEALRAFKRAAYESDLRKAAAVVLRLLADGASTKDVTERLLVPVLVEAGRRWHANTLLSAEVNQLLEVVSHVVSLLTHHDQASGFEHRVLLASAEGERQDLAARLLAAELRRERVSVQFFGPAIPAAELRSVAGRVKPAAVVICCTSPANLAGAAVSVEAAHQAGYPVVVWGPAFGSDPSIAAAIGADALVSDGAGVSALLRSGLERSDPAPHGQAGAVEESQEIRRVAATIRMLALGELSYDLTVLSPDSMRAALDRVLGGIGAALVVGRYELAADAVRWAGAHLVSRGQSPEAANRILLALETAVPERLVRTRDLIGSLLADSSVSPAVAVVPPGAGPSLYHPTPPRPRNEPVRLAAVSRLLPCSEPGPGMAEVVRIAAAVCHVPIAWLSVVRDRMVACLASQGLESEGYVQREVALSSFLVGEKRPLVVPDLSADPRFRSNPGVVDGLRLRFWAGAPLLTESGLVLGALNVADIRPRRVSAEERDILASLAAQVVAQLELHALRDEASTLDLRDAGHMRRAELGRHVLDRLGLPHDAPDTHLLHTSQVAQVLQVSTRTVTNWATEGRLGFVQTTGGHRRFTVDSVIDVLDAMEWPEAVQGLSVN